MRKDSSSQQGWKQVRKANRQQGPVTVGMDLGDKQTCYCVLDGRGEVIQEGSVGTNKKAMAKVFGSMGCCRIALECGPDDAIPGFGSMMVPNSSELEKRSAMLESTLRRLIPEEVRTFAKLKHGAPYYFDRWENDDVGSPCLYYGVKKNKKRLPVSEIHAALHQLRSAGVLSRETFRTVCPIARRDGECGFAVVGRILEALHVAVYSGQDGFKLTNANEATTLLEAKPA